MDSPDSPKRTGIGTSVSGNAANADRTVHGHSTYGAEVVRYDRTGKWYVEHPDGRKRLHVSVDHAARIVVFGQFFPGLPGGRVFDSKVRARRREEAALASRTIRGTIYEAIIKVVVSDPPEKRAREIEEGLAYACALLHDEYGWDAGRITAALENVISGVEWDYGDDDADA